MSLRLEFVMLARAEGANVRKLCGRFGISPKTGYKWLRRFEDEGAPGLYDRSRRPRSSPRRTPPLLEQAVLRVRRHHPTWGGRKIWRVLLREGGRHVPSPSTITEILRRHGELHAEESRKHQAWRRFEAAAPNDLWQMDFKGHFALRSGRCHPLTVLDDHSRFSLGLEACGNERSATVRDRLTAIFRRYGLPARILVDNGSPWGNTAEQPHTPFTAWLMRLGVRVIHSRPFHPQTLGKGERFHRTLRAELLRDRFFESLADCQRHFDRWRRVYNCERPHEALDLRVPAHRYRTSERDYPEVLPPIEYGPGDLVRKVQDKGVIWVQGKEYKIAQAFRGQHVALRPTEEKDRYHVFYCGQKIKEVDLQHPDRIR